MMEASTHSTQTESRYARAIAASKRARWDIDTDVIRGRRFGPDDTFLPDGLSFASKLAFLTDGERRFVSRVQGRTYANLFGMVERFVNAKVLELSQKHLLGDQVALEALVRFSDEELKHQELFRRLERLAAEVMPEGYRFTPNANDVARAVLQQPTWSVLALVCVIELVTQVHYKETIADEGQLSDLFRDVFRFHWMEESQHAVLDELEWLAEDRRLSSAQREAGVSGLIELVGAVDGILQAQAAADSEYFLEHAGRPFSGSERALVAATFLEAYRYQHILSGVERTRFAEMLRGLIGEGQFERVAAAIASLSVEPRSSM